MAVGIAAMAFAFNLAMTWAATYLLVSMRIQDPDRFWALVVASDGVRDYMRWVVPAVWTIPKRLLAEGHHDTAALVQLVLMSAWAILFVVATVVLLPRVFARDRSAAPIPPPRFAGRLSMYPVKANKYLAWFGAVSFAMPAFMEFWAGDFMETNREIFRFEPHMRPDDIYYIGIFLSLAAFGCGLLHLMKAASRIPHPQGIGGC